MDLALANYFGERGGLHYVRERPELVPEGVLSIYRDWDDPRMEESAARVRAALEPRFMRDGAAAEFTRIFGSLPPRDGLAHPQA